VGAADFYDGLAPLYHLVYENWEASGKRQATALDSIIRSALGDAQHRIRDVACGIGTQSLGLAALGHRVTASDLSDAAVQRARQEAASRGLSIDFSVADMRALSSHSNGDFDVVVCMDNSLPHLLNDEDIAEAIDRFLVALRPGGLCLISVRDYAALERGGTQLRPHGVRLENGRRWLLFQLWEWRGAIYDLHFYLVEDNERGPCTTHVFRSSYYAVAIERLIELMSRGGFEQVRRINDVFFQPIISARKPGCS
jgi:SAM-dependent methyltransferase